MGIIKAIENTANEADKRLNNKFNDSFALYLKANLLRIKKTSFIITLSTNESIHAPESVRYLYAIFE